MPSKPGQQAKTMSAIAHGWRPTGSAAKIPVSVAKEFHAADAGKKWGGKHKNTAGPKVAAHYKAQYHRNKAGGGPTQPMPNMMGMPPMQPPGMHPQQSGPTPGAAGQPQQGQGPSPFNPFQPAQPHYQLGGDVIGMHKRPGQGAMENMFKGPIKSSTPGRTDKLRMDVKPGSYIMPADIVSGIGQGNTDAGHNMLKALFTPTGLAGTKMPHGKQSPMMKSMGMSGQTAPAMPKHIGAMGRNIMTGIGHPHGGMGMRGPGMGMRATGGSLAHGGPPSQGPGVKIVAAGGEHVITPEEIIWKFGDLKRGHDMLDRFVKTRRQQHIKEQAALPPPKKKYGGRVN